MTGDYFVYVDGHLDAADGTIALGSTFRHHRARSSPRVARRVLFQVGPGTLVLVDAAVSGDVITTRAKWPGNGTIAGTAHWMQQAYCRASRRARSWSSSAPRRVGSPRSTPRLEIDVRSGLGDQVARRQGLRLAQGRPRMALN